MREPWTSQTDANDGCAVLGFVMLVTGCALLVSLPLALIVGGAILLGVALVGALRKGR